MHDKSIDYSVQENRDALMQEFANYLLQPNRNEDERGFSKFVFNNNKDEEFIKNLSEIREGYVIFHGIKDITDSTDINSVGSWDSQMTIYLDTEHLFSFAGYNGTLFESIFEDFYALVGEANKKKYCISLKYFEETKKSIEGYFYKAGMIKDGKDRPNGKTAMNSILSRCSDRGDILAEEGHFYSLLKSKGIELERRSEYIDDMIGNIQTQSNIDAILEDSISKGYSFKEDDIAKYLRLYSIINNSRRENSRTSFEKCKCVMMSANRIASFVAWHPLVKEDSDFSFSSDVDFITSKLWFKLHKGLISNRKPASFNVLTKAKLVIASLLYNSTHQKYEDLSKKTYTKDDEINVYNNIRAHEFMPEEIDNDNIDEILSFISIKDVDVLRREHSHLEDRATNGDAAIKELKKLKFKQSQSMKNKIRQAIRPRLYLFYTISLFLTIIIGGVVYYTIDRLVSDADTLIGVLSFIGGCIILPLLEKVPPINKGLRKFLYSYKVGFFRKRLEYNI